LYHARPFENARELAGLATIFCVISASLLHVDICGRMALGQ